MRRSSPSLPYSPALPPPTRVRPPPRRSRSPTSAASRRSRWTRRATAISSGTRVSPAGPDVTHYCRVPPGGTSCQASSTFVPTASSPTNNEDFDGPRVFVGGSAVIVMTHRCCGGFPPASSDGTIIYTSTNNGQTFDGGQVVGTADMSGDAIVGPTGQLSTISDVVTGGTFYQALTPGSFTSASANLGDSGSSQSYSGSLALIDANTPIATFDDLDTTFWRRYDGSGSYNDVANWTPTASVGPGEDGTLAYGSAGVWLLYLTGDARRQHLRRAAVHRLGLRKPRAGQRDRRADLRRLLPGPQRPPARRVARRDPRPRLPAGRRRVELRAGHRARSERPSTIFHLEVAAGADGEGWVVWDGNSDRERGPGGRARGRSRAADDRQDRHRGRREGRGVRQAARPAAAARAGPARTAGFVPLTDARSIPVRSILDTRERHGRAARGAQPRGQDPVGPVLGGRLPGAPVAQAEGEGADRAAAEGIGRRLQELPEATAARAPPSRAAPSGACARRRRAATAPAAGTRRPPCAAPPGP